MNSPAPALLRDYSHAAFPGLPFPQGEARAAAMADGLRTLAARHGVKLREPLNINANGEYSIVAAKCPTATEDRGDACGQFGEGFASLIAKHGSRTGALAYGYHHHRKASDDWCKMNHFAVQAMLEDAAAQTV